MTEFLLPALAASLIVIAAADIYRSRRKRKSKRDDNVAFDTGNDRNRSDT